MDANTSFSPILVFCPRPSKLFTVFPMNSVVLVNVFEVFTKSILRNIIVQFETYSSVAAQYSVLFFSFFFWVIYFHSDGPVTSACTRQTGGQFISSRDRGGFFIGDCQTNYECRIHTYAFIMYRRIRTYFSFQTFIYISYTS